MTKVTIFFMRSTVTLLSEDNKYHLINEKYGNQNMSCFVDLPQYIKKLSQSEGVQLVLDTNNEVSNSNRWSAGSSEGVEVLKTICFQNGYADGIFFFPYK